MHVNTVLVKRGALFWSKEGLPHSDNEAAAACPLFETNKRIIQQVPSKYIVHFYNSLSVSTPLITLAMLY